MKLTIDVPDDMVLRLKKIIDETIAELNKWPQKEDECYYIKANDEILYQRRSRSSD